MIWPAGPGHESQHVTQYHWTSCRQKEAHCQLILNTINKLFIYHIYIFIYIYINICIINLLFIWYSSKRHISDFDLSKAHPMIPGQAAAGGCLQRRAKRRVCRCGDPLTQWCSGWPWLCLEMYWTMVIKRGCPMTLYWNTQIWGTMGKNIQKDVGKIRMVSRSDNDLAMSVFHRHVIVVYRESVFV